MSELNVQELVEKVLAYVGTDTSKLTEVLKNMDVLKSVLGDDGKLTADDLQNVVALLKDNDSVKTMLASLSEVSEAGEKAEGLLDKVKGLFSK